MSSASSRMVGFSRQREELPPSMVERITLIMDLFERPYAQLSLEEVTGRTGLPRSTTHRILDQLVGMGWLEHMTTGYRLGPRALGLGGREAGHGALRAAAAPVLHQLALRTGLVVHFAVLEDSEVYYLDKIGGRSAIDVPSRVGGRAPAHCTALGKAMLAWLTPDRVDDDYAHGVTARTVRSIASRDRLHQELSRVRERHGLAYERGECFGDVGCVGVALRGPTGPLGALSLVGEVGTPLERFAPLALGAARSIMDELAVPSAAVAPARPSRALPRHTALIPAERSAAGVG
ncbi:IclR family transcriptional regulator [Streptomyces sp. NPDC058375]|uniref:IclR family transcriptional regulator n=1 Tax=Streptomyces sp. NPDC058375 TaxID=3346467 RepID=UPI003660C56E